jgi:2-dehydro-3-deoxygluconokinase
MAMVDVVTIGECLAVLYPPDPISLDETQTLIVGSAGAEANLALVMAQLGHSVRLIGRVGDDAFGRRVRRTLDGVGVDTTFLHTDSTAPTGLYVREWLPDGMRRVYYYRAGSAGSRLAPKDVALNVIEGAQILHLTGITPALSESCLAAVQHSIALAKATNTLVSFDPNYRARLWEPATARKVLLPLIAQTDILLMGHEDALAIFGTDNAATAMNSALTLGVPMVLFKQAEQGALLRTTHLHLQAPAHSVAQVVDPVGAGDAFDAGFLSGYLRGLPLAEALALGNRFGAKAVSVRGDQLPSSAEVPLSGSKEGKF